MPKTRTYKLVIKQSCSADARPAVEETDAYTRCASACSGRTARTLPLQLERRSSRDAARARSFWNLRKAEETFVFTGHSRRAGALAAAPFLRAGKGEAAT